MKNSTKRVSAFIGLALFINASCSEQATNARSKGNETQVASANAKINEVEVKVTGMTCAACEAAIGSKVKSFPGVVDCKASHKEEMVRLTLEDGQADLGAIKKAIVEMGYEVK